MNTDVNDLRQQLDEARERIKQLEALLWPDVAVPKEIGLTVTEHAYLCCLMAHPVATKENILDCVYRDGVREEPDVKTLDVFIWKLRSRLRRYGEASGNFIVINTEWGRGWSLTPQSKTLVRELAKRETDARLAEVSARVSADAAA